MDCLSMFSQIVAAIYHYMTHLTGFRGIYAFQLASQQNYTKINPKRLGVFSGSDQTASSY